MSALCLSWSLRHCWFGFSLHWAFTAGLTWQLKKQHTECICLCFLLYFSLYPGLSSEKKKKQTNTTHIRRTEFTLTIPSLPFQKSAHAPPLLCIAGRSPAQSQRLTLSLFCWTCCNVQPHFCNFPKRNWCLLRVSDLGKLFKCGVSLCLDQLSWLYLCC